MQPVTASVPASARARTSASAVAAWSTSVLASSIERSVEGLARDAAHEHHHRLDLAALGERQQQRAARLRRSRSAAARWRRARRRRRRGSCGRCSPPSSTPGGRSARGEQVAEPPVALEQVDRHQLVVAPARGEVVDVHLLGARRGSSSRASARKIASASAAPSASSVSRRMPASSRSTPAATLEVSVPVTTSMPAIYGIDARLLTRRAPRAHGVAAGARATVPRAPRDARERLGGGLRRPRAMLDAASGTSRSCTRSTSARPSSWGRSRRAP